MVYDLAIVGGGLAGASLAIALGRQGARLLIVEHQRAFRDRVRGEVTHPCGVAEAVALGIYQHLIGTCGHQTRWWSTPQGRRDLIETTSAGLGCLNFYHPEMQQCLLDLAVAAGAELRRPSEVVGVTPGKPPSMVIRSNGTEERISARLVVGADGRHSKVRAWAGFSVQRDADCLVIAGALHHGLALPEDTVHAIRNPGKQQNILIIPIGRQRFRSYLMFRHDSRSPLSGQRDEAAFVAACVASGAAPEWFANAESIGPLASFNAADHWIDKPYRDGVVLIGEAATAIDPSFGSGISLTLRDVRVLCDQLMANADWATAATAYAEAHDRYYWSLHRQQNWARTLYYSAGPEAEALRAQALPKLAEDPSRRPDIIALGPDAPSDEAARRRFLGIE
jgi:2-polyprenyl-6-methoxyphenol hydroxylase-like FAD-dependent oxidoreductase